MVAVGEDAELCVKLNEPVPASKVLWRANGAEIEPSDHWAMRADGSSYYLVLRRAPLMPRQEITFTAKNAFAWAFITIISKCLIGKVLFLIGNHVCSCLLLKYL